MKIDKNYKMRVTPEQSEKIQKICFEQGYKWKGVVDVVTLDVAFYIFLDSDFSS